jgi:hypothetical protein
MNPVALRRPGIASLLIARDGIAKQWITSFDVTIRRVETPTGTTYELSTVRFLRSPTSKLKRSTIKLSKNSPSSLSFV